MGRKLDNWSFGLSLVGSFSATWKHEMTKKFGKQVQRSELCIPSLTDN